MAAVIKNTYNKIHNSIINITNYKYFNEFYCAIFLFIALFGWRFNDIIGISVLLALSAIILILTNDLNYILPAIINLLFVINTGFLNNEIPITIIIFIAIFVIILSIFLIINIKHSGFKFKKMKSFWGLLGLAVMNLLPIFWCDTISDGYEVFYFFNPSNPYFPAPRLFPPRIQKRIRTSLQEKFRNVFELVVCFGGATELIARHRKGCPTVIILQIQILSLFQDLPYDRF